MSKKRILSSAILGNIVEYYDFGMYAVFASTIGELFFPATESFIQLLLAFSVFAFGFLMRPLGGVVFGYIGDRWGRRISLNISIVGMSISTLIIGILPSYESIGVMATFILVLVRLIQGLCVGGEGTGSAVFILEHMSSSRTSLAGSIVMASNIFGTLLANGVGVLISEFIGLNQFSWRIGFILGAILGVIGIYFRSSNDETPAFQKIKESNLIANNPFAQVIHSKKYAIASVIAVAAAATSIAYFIRGYFGTFLTYNLNYSNEESLYFSIFALSILVIALPLFGILSDKIGYPKFLSFFAFITLITVTPIFYTLVYTDSKFVLYLVIALLSLLAASLCAPAYPYAMRSFPPELRYSGVALGWNIGNALFGGTTPFICTFLTKEFGNTSPSYYLMTTSFLFIGFNLFIMMKIRKIKHNRAKNKLHSK